MIGIERIEGIEKKKIFVQKHFLSPIYFNGLYLFRIWVYFYFLERLQGYYQYQ